MVEKHNKEQCTLHECTFVILGGTGDLSRRKLIPAIYKLVSDKRICKFSILCVSIDETTPQEILARTTRFIDNIDTKIWKTIESRTHYYQMDFHDKKAYDGLGQTLASIEKKHKLIGNRMFYLATMPEHFDEITKNLSRCNIVKPHTSGDEHKEQPWSRVVYEKPFGYDLKSARRINRAISQAFDENQVFRIDHYLGKELVGNIAFARFTNRVFEPLWNKKNIDSVQIILNEKIGIEGRGQFYDSYGVLKDVMQNHMLQLLALIAMEPPKKLTSQHIRDAKARVLKKVQVQSVIAGQYDGYLDEPGVKENSETETFAALKVAIDNRRWEGVPFYLKAGKNLNRKIATILIQFKKVDCMLDVCPSLPNSLVINIEPDEGLYLNLNAKVPGVSNQITPVTMEFAHAALFGPNTPAAYELLFSDIIRKDHVTFVRNDEIELSWKIIEQAYKLKKNVYRYEKGSDGPEELKNLDPERNITWRA